MIIVGKNGYGIPCEMSIPKGVKTIVVAMHGFCGDKESSCIKLLEERVGEIGVGLVRFDWPGHGESEVDGFSFRVENCIKDLEAVVEYLKERYPEAELVAFATSFGGYVTLLYNYYHRDDFRCIILRSPAIQMRKVVYDSIINPDVREELDEKGYFVYGFERKMEITNEFLDDLMKYDVLDLYGEERLENVSIIHGTADDLVPFGDSEEFAREHGCRLYPVEGADHRYKKEGELEKVMVIALDELKGLDG